MADRQPIARVEIEVMRGGPSGTNLAYRVKFPRHDFTVVWTVPTIDPPGVRYLIDLYDPDPT